LVGTGILFDFFFNTVSFAKKAKYKSSFATIFIFLPQRMASVFAYAREGENLHGIVSDI